MKNHDIEPDEKPLEELEDRDLHLQPEDEASGDEPAELDGEVVEWFFAETGGPCTSMHTTCSLRAETTLSSRPIRERISGECARQEANRAQDDGQRRKPFSDWRNLTKSPAGMLCERKRKRRCGIFSRGFRAGKCQ